MLIEQPDRTDEASRSCCRAAQIPRRAIPGEATRQAISAGELDVIPEDDGIDKGLNPL